MSDEYIEVPVTLSFNKSQPIGTLRIYKAWLPDVANYHFEVGGREQIVNGIRKFELLEVSLCLTPATEKF